MSLLTFSFSEAILRDGLLANLRADVTRKDKEGNTVSRSEHIKEAFVVYAACCCFASQQRRLVDSAQRSLTNAVLQEMTGLSRPVITRACAALIEGQFLNEHRWPSDEWSKGRAELNMFEVEMYVNLFDSGVVARWARGKVGKGSQDTGCPAALVVYALLKSYVSYRHNSRGYHVYPCIATLAKFSGYGKTVVKQALWRLEAEGFIEPNKMPGEVTRWIVKDQLRVKDPKTGKWVAVTFISGSSDVAALAFVLGGQDEVNRWDLGLQEYEKDSIKNSADPVDWYATRERKDGSFHRLNDKRRIQGLEPHKTTKDFRRERAANQKRLTLGIPITQPAA